jgi:alpha-glucosidase
MCVTDRCGAKQNNNIVIRIDMKKRLTLTFWGMLVAFSVMAEAVKVTSPDGEYEFTVSDDGQLSYSLFYQQKEVIEPSRLGIEWNENWYDGIRIVTSRNSRIDKNWKPVYGERAVVKELYNACEIELAKTGSRKRMVLDVRAYNEGVAFRYRFVGGEYLKIENEFTQFTLPKGTLAWHTERAQTPYNLLPLEGWENESDRPLMLQLPEGQYACLAEAQVVDYVRTKFKLSDEKPYTLLTSMYGIVEDIAPYHTPWRIVMCASRPGDILANNDLLLNLNPDCKIADTSWIKPGKVMREVTLTTEGGKALVDFAVKRRLQYIHFDAGWYGFEYDKSSDATTVTLDPRRNEQIDALNLQEVISYAKSKGIGVILYVNQRALQNSMIPVPHKDSYEPALH